MATPIGEEDAYEAVKAIRKEHGEADQEWLAAQSDDVRAKVEEILEAKNRQIGQSINVLATQLYSSGARFIFELLQNADDNQYSIAERNGEQPRISFDVYRDRIIVESNEDGFTPENLRAICHVGKSTKTASYGYIGAKGIGFKSVFIVASDVHIQSAGFSFKFKEKPNDPGLWMIVPLWETPTERLIHPLTRMTLQLRKDRNVDDIKRQFRDMKETCLLFLRKIKSIRVTFYDADEDEDVSEQRHFSQRQDASQDHIVSIVAKTLIDGNTENDERRFFVTSETGTDLPKSSSRKDDLRIDSVKDKDSKTAEVVLAFPLNKVDDPIIAKQQIFAFLPVRESPFPFLIHSDFDTDANRQDIVSDTPRNLALRDLVAATFVKAVLQFCNHLKLNYTWPHFLPNLEDGASFWSALPSLIKTKLVATPCLRGRLYPSGLHRISDVFILAGDFMDEYKAPLLDYIDRDWFLSPSYSAKSRDLLTPYGLQVSHFDIILGLLKKDLDSDLSRYRSGRGNGWHIRLAKLLKRIASTNSKRKAELAALKLLPVQSTPITWASAANGEVYLPQIEGVRVPPSCGFNIVVDDGISERQELFKCLGVKEAERTKVWTNILASFLILDGGDRTIKQRKELLEFLYLTQQHCEDLSTLAPYSPSLGSTVQYLRPYYTQADRTTWMFINIPHIHVVDYRRRQNRMKRLGNETTYLLGRHPGGLESVLDGAETPKALEFAFLDPSYLEYRPEPPNSTSLDWESWLCEAFGVKKVIPLFADDIDTLSNEFKFVVEHNKPKLLGTLKYLWNQHSSQAEQKKMAIGELHRLPVLQSGDQRSQWLRLCRTSLPLEVLRGTCEKLIGSHRWFPFLDLGPEFSDDDAIRGEWGFLSKFQVCKEDNMRFLMDLLYWIKHQEGTIPDLNEDQQRIAKLLLLINGKLEGDIRKEQRVLRSVIVCITHLIHVNDQLRDHFEFFGLLYVPSREEISQDWARPVDCTWNGPLRMKKKHALRARYESIVSRPQLDLLENLFNVHLEVPKLSWQDLADELQHMSDNKVYAFDLAEELYSWIHRMPTAAEVGEIRTRFESSALILVKGQSNRWLRASQCLWSSKIDITNMTALDGQYGKLKKFFTDTLAIATMTPQMVYDELRSTKPEADRGLVQRTLLTFNEYLRDGSHEFTHDHATEIMKAPVFLVKHPSGSRKLVPAASGFAIPDRDYFRSAFEGRIRILDYSIEEVKTFEPTLDWLGITHYYLSRSAKEAEIVPRGIRGIVHSKQSDLRQKAFTILRVAAHFGSSRYTKDKVAVFEQLRSVEVLQADEFLSEYEVLEDGNQIRVPAGLPLQIHIKESDGGLKIFVPVQESKQRYAFGRLLQEKLGEWLMTPRTVLAEVQSALGGVMVADLATLDEFLKQDGIIEISSHDLPNFAVHPAEGDVDGADVYNVDSDDNDNGDNDNDDDALTMVDDSVSPNLVPATPGVRSSPQPSLSRTSIENTVQTGQQAHTSFARDRYQSSRGPAPVPSASSPSATPATDRPRPTHSADSEDLHYVNVLQRVLTAASSRDFPSLDSTFDMSSMLDAINNVSELSDYDDEVIADDNMPVSFPLRDTSERRKKIGAAGELFMYTLLSGMGLPDWSVENWTSTIRSKVLVHATLRELGPWSGTVEEADLTYMDTTSELTKLPIEKGYLDRSRWQGQRPKYYIEVKTTRGSSNQPFFMSQSQFSRMKRAHKARSVHEGRTVREEVYVVCRVFNVEGPSSDIDMKVYVDPYRLMDDKLAFQARGYSVRPSGAVTAENRA